MISREDHLKYCREEAYACYEFHLSGHEYSKPDQAIRQAVTTMLVDLGKHPETEKLAENFISMAWMINTEHEMRRFIDSFN